MSTSLYNAYRQLVQDSVCNDFDDNYDYRRFGMPADALHVRGEPAPATRLGTWAGVLADGARSYARAILSPRGEANSPATVAQQWIRPWVNSLEWVYQRLVDQQSKDLLVRILAFRALGHRRVKLPLNNPHYWGLYAQLDSMTRHAKAIDLGFNEWQAHRLRLHRYGYPLELYARPGGVLTQMLLQQYRCNASERVIEAAEGDTVIDAGGCFGDTALYFAHKIGDRGRVVSCEFEPSNLRVFERNLALNPDHARRIRIVRHPLWETSGQRLCLQGSGPACQVVAPRDPTHPDLLETVSIDDLVGRQGLSKVDFIKMDIEGAELMALKGARNTIQAFSPKLAIAVYHRLRDFWEIPMWIEGLGRGYCFYLRHFTIHQEETILFADVVR